MTARSWDEHARQPPPSPGLLPLGRRPSTAEHEYVHGSVLHEGIDWGTPGSATAIALSRRGREASGEQRDFGVHAVLETRRDIPAWPTPRHRRRTGPGQSLGLRRADPQGDRVSRPGASLPPNTARSIGRIAAVRRTSSRSGWRRVGSHGSRRRTVADGHRGLHRADDRQRRFAIADTVLSRRRTRGPSAAPVVMKALGTLHRSGGQFSVHALASACGCSERLLEHIEDMRSKLKRLVGLDWYRGELARRRGDDVVEPCRRCDQPGLDHPGRPLDPARAVRPGRRWRSRTVLGSPRMLNGGGAGIRHVHARTERSEGCVHQ